MQWVGPGNCGGVFDCKLKKFHNIDSLYFLICNVENVIIIKFENCIPIAGPGRCLWSISGGCFHIGYNGPLNSGVAPR